MIETKLILCGLVFSAVFILWYWSDIATERNRPRNIMIAGLISGLFALVALGMFFVGQLYLVPTP